MIERGTITRIDGRQVYVEVPRLGLGVQFGPCDVAWQSEATLPSDGQISGDGTTHGHSDAGSGPVAHRHALPKLTVGQRVLVAPVHGIPDDVVVLGIIG